MLKSVRPTLDEFWQAAAELAPHVRQTPLVAWSGAPPMNAEIFLKLELFQHAGSFKTRAAILNIMRLRQAERERGVTAVSAGNHAVAVAYAANQLGVDATVVMQSTANPARVALVRRYGASIVFAADGASAFRTAENLASKEGRSLIHPFEGAGVALGTGTIGLELARQSYPLDAVVVAVGGGGLAGGLATAINQLWPQCEVLGVEPEGADAMSRSFAAGSPQTLPSVSTIADSLAPPFALPYSFALCRYGLADLVTVSDDAIREAMSLLFHDAKLTPEPAAAAALAAATGPYRERLRGRRMAIIICGGNIDVESFCKDVRAGTAIRDQRTAEARQAPPEN